MRLGDGQADEFLGRQHVRNDLHATVNNGKQQLRSNAYLCLEFFRAEVEYRRQTNDHTALQTIREATSTTPCKLLSDDEFVEVVELGTFVSNRTHIQRKRRTNLFWLDNATHQCAALEMLAWAHRHGEDASLTAA